MVNDNLYTNVMARFNLRAAAALEHPDVPETERMVWQQAAARMSLPYDPDMQIYSQDNDFMTLEPWDWSTPRSKYPLLLNFHPLVIYRHQVLKQADTVLAMFLQWQDFTAEEKQRAFDFYDPITTGDSTLSACVQGIMAAEVGYSDIALKHFTEALFIDLDNTHNNTVDGVHIASTGGIWSSWCADSRACGTRARSRTSIRGCRPNGTACPSGSRSAGGCCPWSCARAPSALRWCRMQLRLRPPTPVLHLRKSARLWRSACGASGSSSASRGITVPLDEVPVPEPSVFPSLFPTAGLPVIGSRGSKYPHCGPSRERTKP